MTVLGSAVNHRRNCHSYYSSSRSMHSIFLCLLAGTSRKLTDRSECAIQPPESVDYLLDLPQSIWSYVNGVEGPDWNWTYSRVVIIEGGCGCCDLLWPILRHQCSLKPARPVILKKYIDNINPFKRHLWRSLHDTPWHQRTKQRRRCGMLRQV